jgi:hypothetical protein
MLNKLAPIPPFRVDMRNSIGLLFRFIAARKQGNLLESIVVVVRLHKYNKIKFNQHQPCKNYRLLPIKIQKPIISATVLC